MLKWGPYSRADNMILEDLDQNLRDCADGKYSIRLTTDKVSVHRPQKRND